jgi:hypothetical protein
MLKTCCEHIGNKKKKPKIIPRHPPPPPPPSKWKNKGHHECMLSLYTYDLHIVKNLKKFEMSTMANNVLQCLKLFYTIDSCNDISCNPMKDFRSFMHLKLNWLYNCEYNGVLHNMHCRCNTIHDMKHNGWYMWGHVPTPPLVQMGFGA